jgi:hypothetical protein
MMGANSLRPECHTAPKRICACAFLIENDDRIAGVSMGLAKRAVRSSALGAWWSIQTYDIEDEWS